MAVLLKNCWAEVLVDSVNVAVQHLLLVMNDFSFCYV
jgi:hypothetical protein